MLGGGVGRLQGLHGLTSDAVRKIRMVLWNGTIVEASDNVNQDLFWGMRGAGQNFGVVIETTFKTFPATNGGMHYEADLIFSLDSLGALIDTVNSMIPLHPALSLIVLALADPVTLEIVVVLNLVYAGTMKKGQKYTEKFTPFSLSLTESMIAWVDLPTKSAGGAVVAQCATGKRQDMHGMLTKYLHKPSFIEMFNDFASFIKAYPAANASGLLIETFAQQGVDALPDNYDAFPHRGKLNNFIEIDIVYVDDSVAEVGDAWAKKWRDYFAQPTISGYDKWFVYQNYGHGDEPPSVLYGYDEWRHKRLTALKNTYDPHGVFNAFHAIPSDLASWT
jgi:fumiquinazoline A oxidase